MNGYDNEDNGRGNYIDYTDLSEDKRKALYEEFLKAYPDEKRLSRTLRIAPIAFAAVVIAFVIASIVLYFVSGIDIPMLVMMGMTFLSLLAFIIFKVRLDKIRLAHSARYAAWLLDVKHVVAELKEK